MPKAISKKKKVVAKKKTTEKKVAVVEVVTPAKGKVEKFSVLELRHKKVFDKMLENGGSVSQAMRDVGYEDNYAKNPHKLTNTKSFQRMFKENTNQEEVSGLIQRNMRALKPDMMRVPLEATDEDIQALLHELNCILFKITETEFGKLVYYYQADYQASNKAIDLTLKVLQAYAEPPDHEEKNKIATMSDRELQDEIKRLQNFYKKIPNNKKPYVESK